jgi:hypothetical protein
MVKVLKLNLHQNQSSQISRTKTKVEIKVPPMCETRTISSLQFFTFKKKSIIMSSQLITNWFWYNH